MKIVFNTDTRTIKESKLSRLDKHKSNTEREMEIVSLLSLAIVANANKNYKSTEGKKAFAKLVCGTALREMGDCSMLKELDKELSNVKEAEGL